VLSGFLLPKLFLKASLFRLPPPPITVKFCRGGSPRDMPFLLPVPSPSGSFLLRGSQLFRLTPCCDGTDHPPPFGGSLSLGDQAGRGFFAALPSTSCFFQVIRPHLSFPIQFVVCLFFFLNFFFPPLFFFLGQGSSFFFLPAGSLFFRF